MYTKILRAFLAVYYLKSIVKYNATRIVCNAFHRISRNVQIRENCVFPKSREFPENPRKIPGKPRGKIRGFFMFYGCNRL